MYNISQDSRCNDEKQGESGSEGEDLNTRNQADSVSATTGKPPFIITVGVTDFTCRVIRGSDRNNKIKQR